MIISHNTPRPVIAPCAQCDCLFDTLIQFDAHGTWLVCSICLDCQEAAAQYFEAMAYDFSQDR